MLWGLWLASSVALAAPPLATLPLPDAASEFAFHPDREVVAVGLVDDQAVVLMDSLDGAALWQVSVGFVPTSLHWLGADTLVVGGANATTLVTIDSRTGALSQGFELPGGISGLASDPELGTVYAAHPDNQSISVIRLAAEEARLFSVPGIPIDLAYNPASETLLVSLADAESLNLLQLDPATGQPLAQTRGGGDQINLDVARQRLVALNPSQQSLTVVNLRTNQTAIIGLTWPPTSFAIQGQLAYVAAAGSNRLEVVDLASLQLEAEYTLASPPIAIATRGNSVVMLAERELQWLDLNATIAAAPVISAGVGGVAGQVTDVAGNPVSAGELRLLAQGRSNVNSRSLNLLPDGSFLVADLPPGLYLADIVVPGFPLISTQIDVRSGFVTTRDIRLPPGRPDTAAEGIGLLPDGLTFSDELAYRLIDTVQTLAGDAPVIPLVSPLGLAPEFEQLAFVVEDLSLIDRDERLTQDLERLRVVTNTLGLRYILLTHVETSRNFSRAGNPFVNLAFRFLVPGVPIEIPNLSPNQLRSRGVVVVIDMLNDRPGDPIRSFEASGRDDVGGEPLYDEATASYFRQQITNMIPSFAAQWQDTFPFPALRSAAN